MEPYAHLSTTVDYRGRLTSREGSDGHVLHLDLPALGSIQSTADREEVREILARGHESFYARIYVSALRHYRRAEEKVAGLPADDPLRLSVRIYVADALHELFRFQDAAKELIEVSKHLDRDDREPVTPTTLWTKLAKAYLAEGDALYRSAAYDVESRQLEIEEKFDRILGAGQAPDSSSPLYQNVLFNLTDTVRRVVRSIDDQTVRTDNVNAEIVAIVYDCRRRFDQLAAGLNFIGHSERYVPILRYKHLQGVARSFAQTAGQANREYISYVTKVQNETFTQRQLEQAVEVNRAGVAVHRSATNAARLEDRAARQAQALARTRREAAARYERDYATVGYESVLLETALSWAQATALPDDEQIKLQYEGLEHLGIARRYQPRSDLIHELTWERARRNYDMQRRRLQDQVSELREAEKLAADQRKAAKARAETAALREKAAEARLRHSIENLEAVRSREIGIEFFSAMASLVRETADVYLQHAMLIAFMMEKAYQFETGNKISRIRLDYGDIDGAEGVYAADLLLRDIDHFTFQSIIEAENKIQPAMRVISLAKEYPLEFLKLRSEGEMRFTTFLSDFQRSHPGLYNGRIKKVIVKVLGLVGTQGPFGRLICNGVSKFRTIENKVMPKMHASEPLLLSAFDSRQDSVYAAAPQEQLDIFENIGLETDWLLEIKQSNNSFDVSKMTDVTLYITFLCEVDSELTSIDLESVPTHEEAETRFSFKIDFGRSALQKLERDTRLEFEIEKIRLPRSHMEPRLRALRFVAIGKDGRPIPMVLRVWSSAHGSANDRYDADGDGVVVVLREDQTDGHFDKPLLTTWQLELRPAENPDLQSSDVGGRPLDLSGIEDIFMVPGYRHRTR